MKTSFMDHSILSGPNKKDDHELLTAEPSEGYRIAPTNASGMAFQTAISVSV
jgi:hypothetical protein